MSREQEDLFRRSRNTAMRNRDYETSMEMHKRLYGLMFDNYKLARSGSVRKAFLLENLHTLDLIEKRIKLKLERSRSN